VNYESDRYYELLGVEPGASGQELKDAYRDLAKVWHPDRFSHDPRLQQKAQEKLKEINEAYAQLTSGKVGRRTRPRPAQGQPQNSAPSRPQTPSTSNPFKPDVPATTTVRSKRTRLVIPTALVFCAVFFAALSSLVSSGMRSVPVRTPTTESEEAQADDKAQQPESVPRAAAPTPRGKERTGRQPASETTDGGDTDAGTGAAKLRPMPTVTVTIDAVTGLLATSDCPTVSRMTYPAGAEPRSYCTTPHKTKVAARPEPERTKGSRLKSVAKRLATPFN
jgi:hypothetical protein